MEPWDDGDILAVINRRERQILVHSFLYYQLNDNLISDHEFDAISRDLVRLIQEYPEEFGRSVYRDGFRDFDGSTGYNLPYGNPEIQNTGHRLLAYDKKLRKK